MQSFVWSKLLLALNRKENQLGLKSIVFDCVQCYAIGRFLYLHFSLTLSYLGGLVRAFSDAAGLRYRTAEKSSIQLVFECCSKPPVHLVQRKEYKLQVTNQCSHIKQFNIGGTLTFLFHHHRNHNYLVHF